jgi:hypothetical protein
MELAFAQVHRLCEFGRRHLAAARPHENALSAAFGVEEGGAPDRFLVAFVTVHIDEPLRSRLELLGAAGRLVHADGGDPRRADRPGPADLQAGRGRPHKPEIAAACCATRSPQQLPAVPAVPASRFR